MGGTHEERNQRPAGSGAWKATRTRDKAGQWFQGMALHTTTHHAEKKTVKTLGFNKTNTNPLRGDSHNTPDPTGGACRHVCLPASTQVPDSQERTGAALRAPCLAQVWSQTVNTAVGRLQVPGVPSKFVEETMRKFYLTFLSGRMRKQAYYLIILVRVLSSLEKRF